MSAPLLRSFDRLDDATAARNELVAAGFSPAAVQVRAMEDEAGPVQGYFTVATRISNLGIPTLSRPLRQTPMR